MFVVGIKSRRFGNDDCRRRRCYTFAIMMMTVMMDNDDKISQLDRFVGAIVWNTLLAERLAAFEWGRHNSAHCFIVCMGV